MSKNKVFYTLPSQLQVVKSQIISKLLSFALYHYGESSIDKAWELFCVWEEKKYNPESPEKDVFLMWYLFCWHPEVGEVEPRPNPPAAQICLDKTPDDFDRASQDIIKEGLKSIPIFYEIRCFENDRKVSLYNCLTQKIHTDVYAPELSKVSKGSFILGVVIPVMRGMNIVLGYGSVLPTESKSKITDFYEFVHRCDVDMELNFNHFFSEVFGLYYDLREYDFQ